MSILNFYLLVLGKLLQLSKNMVYCLEMSALLHGEAMVGQMPRDMQIL